MTCERLDELAAAYALGAVPPDEERAMSEHLATCEQPHEEASELIGAAGLLPAALPPVAPSAALRDRLMATVERTPQDHRRPAAAEVTLRAELRRSWWQLAPLPTALAAVALAIAVGLGAWSLDLNRQLAERDDALSAVASAA